MRILIFAFLFFFAQASRAQLHQDVFPNESGSTLLSHLATAYKPTNPLTYKEARNFMFGELDNVNDSIYGVYTHDVIYVNHNSNDPKGDAYDKGFNTEHTFPQSLGATGNAKSDLHHLFPTRTDVNGDRGHLPFAEIIDTQTDNWYYKNQEIHYIPNSNIDEYSELDLNNTFEPREAHKGNVARAIMYFYTIYKDQASSSFFEGMKPTLCAWHYEDAVDQQEWDRTMGIKTKQGNANPFVLDCTLPERSYCAGMGFECSPDATDEAKHLVKLFGVFPNPTRLAAKIRFTLESYAPSAELTVFDMMGKKIETQWVQGLSAGPNELFVDTSSWQSGFYIYSVQVGGDVASGKLVVY